MEKYFSDKGVSITMIIFIIGKKSMNLLQIIKKKKLM